MSDLFDHLDDARHILAQRPCGLVTDLDGTLSDIAPTPAEAQLHPACRTGLAQLAARLDLVGVVSGRPVADVRRLVDIEGIEYVGAQGFERGRGDTVERWGGQEAARRTRTAIAALRTRLSIDGLLFEDKGALAAIHYRQVTHPERALPAIWAALAKTPEARGLVPMEAKRAVELRPSALHHKGTALMDLAAEAGLQGLFYLGDDLTDLDAFRSLHSWQTAGRQALAIAVLSDETPGQVARGADHYLRGIAEVARFLAWLADEAGGKQ